MSSLWDLDRYTIPLCVGQAILSLNVHSFVHAVVFLTMETLPLML